MSQVSTTALGFLSTRRSYPAKAMVPPVPSREALMAILAIATRVPDHGKLEPWRLVVIEKPAMTRLADLAEARGVELGYDAEKIAKGRGQFDRGLLAVAVIASPVASDKVPELEQTLSAGALCFAIVAAAQASGWGANWLTGWAAHDATFAARAFGCTGQEYIAGIIHIATEGAALSDRPRPDLSRLVTWAPE
jgi:nitroreductase